MTGLAVLAGALVLTGALAVLYRWQDGRLHHTRDVKSTSSTGRERDLRPLIPRAGQRATLLQFSSAFCAPCRATRRTLGEVAAAVDGVEHVEIDAESHLALVRQLHVLKTPTTLILDAEGKEVLRASGQPRKADVLQALQQAVSS